MGEYIKILSIGHFVVRVNATYWKTRVQRSKDYRFEYKILLSLIHTIIAIIYPRQTRDDGPNKHDYRHEAVV